MRRSTRLLILAASVLALVTVILVVPVLADADQTGLVLAVARFDDRSGSGLANVGDGVADLLVERLINAGYRVVERQEIDSIIAERGLNPLFTGDVAEAARIVGADLLLIGSVTKVDIQESTISLGFLTFSGATVTIDVSIRAVDVYTSEIVGAASVEGQAEGQTGFSLNIGQLLGTLSSWRANVCTGGFLSDKGSYVQGEIVNFGYKDPAPAHVYRVMVKDSGGTVIWVSPWAGSTPASPCVTFSWDQKDSFSNPVPPGSYTAELWLGVSSMVASRPFTITSGTPPAWMSEITVGTEQFMGTVVGQALDNALDELLTEIGEMIAGVEGRILAERAQAGSQGPTESLKARVVDIWSDGTIVIDAGSSDGVQQFEIFEVYSAAEIRDPSTGELIEVIPASATPKGEMILTRVEEHVALGSVLGPDFPVSLGDLAIRKE